MHSLSEDIDELKDKVRDDWGALGTHIDFDAIDTLGVLPRVNLFLCLIASSQQMTKRSDKPRSQLIQKAEQQALDKGVNLPAVFIFEIWSLKDANPASQLSKQEASSGASMALPVAAASAASSASPSGSSASAAPAAAALTLASSSPTAEVKSMGKGVKAAVKSPSDRADPVDSKAAKAADKRKQAEVPEEARPKKKHRKEKDDKVVGEAELPSDKKQKKTKA